MKDEQITEITEIKRKGIGRFLRITLETMTEDMGNVRKPRLSIDEASIVFLCGRYIGKIYRSDDPAHGIVTSDGSTVVIDFGTPGDPAKLVIDGNSISGGFYSHSNS